MSQKDVVGCNVMISVLEKHGRMKDARVLFDRWSRNFRLIACGEFRCKWTLYLDSLDEFICKCTLCLDSLGEFSFDFM